MYFYKVQLCTKSAVHDWTSCPFAHIGETALRRDPRAVGYSCQMCPEIQNGDTCPRGEKCPFSHSVFESWLHPQRYKTKLCRQGDQCARSVCFFAHSLEDLRIGVEDPDSNLFTKDPVLPSPARSLTGSVSDLLTSLQKMAVWGSGEEKDETGEKAIKAGLPGLNNGATVKEAQPTRETPVVMAPKLTAGPVVQAVPLYYSAGNQGNLLLQVQPPATHVLAPAPTVFATTGNVQYALPQPAYLVNNMQPYPQVQPQPRCFSVAENVPVIITEPQQLMLLEQRPECAQVMTVPDHIQALPQPQREGALLTDILMKISELNPTDMVQLAHILGVANMQ